MRWILLMVFLPACATSAVSTNEHPEAPTVKAATRACDIADECCYIENVKWCCFDNGKQIRCWKGEPLDLTQRAENVTQNSRP